MGFYSEHLSLVEFRLSIILQPSENPTSYSKQQVPRKEAGKQKPEQKTTELEDHIVKHFCFLSYQTVKCFLKKLVLLWSMT